MSIEHAAPPGGRWKTVQPVGPSSYSATPTRSPGKSKRSSRLMRRGRPRARRRARRSRRRAPVHLQRPPAALLVQSGEDERRQALAGRAELLGLGQRALDQRRRRRCSRGGGLREQDAAPPSSQCAAAMPRASSADSTRCETGGPAGRVVEARQRVRPPAEHGDAERLEQLRGRLHVQQRLGARRRRRRPASGPARSGRPRRRSGGRGGRRRSRRCP